ALAALKPRVAPLFARLTRLARFSGLPLVAAFAAFRTETVAAAAIAATTEIPITTIAAIELLLAFALREIDVRLFAASLSCVSLTLAAFAVGAAFFIAFVIVIEALAVHLLHRHCRLHLAHQPEIVIGVLHVVLAQHTVARRRRVARKLEI